MLSLDDISHLGVAKGLLKNIVIYIFVKCITNGMSLYYTKILRFHSWNLNCHRLFMLNKKTEKSILNQFLLEENIELANEIQVH